MYLCIKGAFSAGLFFIVLAIFAAPPTEVLITKLFRKRKINQGILIGKNIVVVTITAAILLHLNYIGITPQRLYTSFLHTESSMAQSETIFLTDEGVSPGSEKHDSGSNINFPDINFNVTQGSPITDSAFSLYDRIEEEISKSAREGEQIIRKIADNDPLTSGKDTDKESPADNANTINIDGMEVHFLDVGQGDCILILCNNEAMLVDSGASGNGTLLQNYLTKKGVRTLKYLILTHPDADHIGSADVIITKFNIENVFTLKIEKDTKAYERVADALKYKEYTSTTPSTGNQYAIGNAVFEILGPIKIYEESNDSSIVFKLTHGQNTFLFTGDAGESAEKDMLSSGIDLSADVLKVSHHGSNTGSSKEFISAVAPSYAVISCAEGNDYHHPHPSVLNTLRSSGVKLFRTDEQGTIVITSNMEELSFNCSPSESWASGS